MKKEDIDSEAEAYSDECELNSPIREEIKDAFFNGADWMQSKQGERLTEGEKDLLINAYSDAIYYDVPLINLKLDELNKTLNFRNDKQ